MLANIPIHGKQHRKRGRNEPDRSLSRVHRAGCACKKQVGSFFTCQQDRYRYHDLNHGSQCIRCSPCFLCILQSPRVLWSVSDRSLKLFVFFWQFATRTHDSCPIAIYSFFKTSDVKNSDNNRCLTFVYNQLNTPRVDFGTFIHIHIYMIINTITVYKYSNILTDL